MNQELTSEQLAANSAYAEPYADSAREVLRRLESDRRLGLNPASVESARAKHGRNEITQLRTTPWWKRFLAQFKELLVWILIVAAGIAAAMGEWVDAVAILAIVLLNGILGFIQEHKASRALAALRALSSPTAKILRGGTLTSVPATEVVPGDIVRIEAGDHVPADARLIESYSLSLQEASLTGESVPVRKNADTILQPGTSIGDRENSVFMGTLVTAGKADAVVVEIGMRTELGQIAGMLSQSEPDPTPLQRRLTELGKVLVVVCVSLVGVIFAIEALRGEELLETLLVAVSLAVAAVPEGLPAVVTIALALGLQRMVKRNALIRKLPSVETLGSVTVICSDKTGTLTKNEMTVREIFVGDRAYAITGTGYEPEGDFLTIGSNGKPRQEEKIIPGENADLKQAITISAVCNNSKVVPAKQKTKWDIFGDPTEAALVAMAMKSQLYEELRTQKVVHEIPFDSERKTMSVIVYEHHGESMYSKGAPEVILDKCVYELRSGKAVPLSAERRDAINQRNSEMASRALRVLALAYRELPDVVNGQYQEDGLTFVGLIGMIDPPREEVKVAVEECHHAGIQPVMITGDHPETALAIGRELHLALTDSRAVTGKELDQMTDEALEDQVTSIPVYARVSAAHKLRVVQAWKKKGHVVAMTGDGVNDAPAVQSADIGIAMGITGTDVTKEAADMVLSDDNFASIVSAVREGRGIFDNIQKFVHYLLSCNAGEVLLMFAAALFGMPLPMIAIQILWINLVTDGLPALALAQEPPEPGIMRRKPRPIREPVISLKRGLSILYHGVLMAASALIGFGWVYQANSQDLPLARTAAFAIVAFSQLAFALVCRSSRFTLPQLGLFTNKWLFAAIVASGFLQATVLILPATQSVFDTVPMSPMTWLFVLFLSLIPATFVELMKVTISFIRKRDTMPSGNDDLEALGAKTS